MTMNLKSLCKPKAILVGCIVASTITMTAYAASEYASQETTTIIPDISSEWYGSAARIGKDMQESIEEAERIAEEERIAAEIAHKMAMIEATNNETLEILKDYKDDIDFNTYFDYEDVEIQATDDGSNITYMYIGDYILYEGKTVKEDVYAKKAVNLREGPSTNSKVLTTVNTGTKMTRIVDTAYTWDVVVYNDKTYYIHDSLISTTKPVVTTTTKTTNSGSVYSGSVSDVTLLAAIIECEGNSNYNARLAVATVIMNRVESGKFPNTISGVVYAKGQFSPTWTGKLAKKLASGPSAACITAATDAINGARLSSVSHCYYFLAASSTSRSGVNVGGNLFFASW